MNDPQSRAAATDAHDAPDTLPAPLDALARGALFAFEGTVAQGRHVGRRLGYPTANLTPPDDAALPENGVYIALLRVPERGATLPAILNQGVAPTFDVGRLCVEAHALAPAGDLYGCRARVFYLKRLRAEKRFASADELRDQLAADRAAAEAWLRERGIAAPDGA